MNNITSQKLMTEFDNLVTNYIESAKKKNKKVTREDIIEILTKRLKEIIDLNAENDEHIWIASGMAVGMALVLQIEDKLKEIYGEEKR